LVIGAIVALPGAARADWPQARHDAQRTASASGKSNLTSPAPYWKTFLGGSVGPASLAAADADGDGKRDLVYVEAGRLVARSADGKAIWTSDPLALTNIVGVADLDGDGVEEVIAQTSSQVIAVDAKTGKAVWIESPDDMGTLGAVRIADFDGDGRAEILVHECACCSITNGKTGFVYSFAGGFGAPKVSWTLPSVSCDGGGRTTVVLDVDGNGKREVTLGTMHEISLYDAATGTFRATTGNLGDWIMRSSCVPVDLDGVAGDELVCILNSTETAVGQGHQAFALKLVGNALQTMWTKPIGEVDASVTFGEGLLDDLDGDGKRELTLTGHLAGGAARTYVLDAKTGLELATIDNQHVLGALGLDDKTKKVLLTSDDQGIDAWSFDRAAAPKTATIWTIAGVRAPTFPDVALGQLHTVQYRLVAADFNGDGLPDLVTSRPSGDGTKLEAQSAVNKSPTVIATDDRPDTRLATAFIEPPLDTMSPQLVTSWTDGLLFAHDGKMKPVYAPGIRVGGFYVRGNWGTLDHVPVVGNLGGKGDSILVTASSGSLLRIDAPTASFVSPPTTTWKAPSTFSAAIIPGLANGGPGIVAQRITSPLGSPPPESIVALDPNGSVLWSAPTPGGRVFEDIVPGKLNGDAIPDFAFQWGNDGDVLVHTRAINGATGATLWDAAPLGPGPTRQPAGITITDWDGDGHDDVIHQLYGTRVLSGKTGNEIAKGGPNDAYFLPVITDVDGDGTTEVILQGGYTAVRAFTHDLLGELWTATDPNDTFPYGAVANCPGLPARLIESSFANPSRARITDLSNGAVTTLVLAGGKLFADEAAAKAAGARGGQLTSATVHQDLTGAGRPTALFGSGDGFLYGINPCATGLDFAVDFGAPVGMPVFGDTDGDGIDEMLVSIADGYLYALKQPPVPAPTYVWDIDPTHGVSDHDVDTIVTNHTLYGAWASSPGATSYQIAVVRESTNTIVTAPAWQDVGHDVSAAVDVPLIDGERYLFAVRAMKGDAPSPDVISNGVKVMFGMPGDAGFDASMDDAGEVDAGVDAGSSKPDDVLVEGSGCLCSAPGGGEGVGAALALSMFALGAIVVARRSK
jgi:hypothetical protein